MRLKTWGVRWGYDNDRDKLRLGALRPVYELSLHFEELDASSKALQVGRYRLLGCDGICVRRRRCLQRRLGAVEVLRRVCRDGAPAPGALLLVALRVVVAAASGASRCRARRLVAWGRAGAGECGRTAPGTRVHWVCPVVGRLHLVHVPVVLCGGCAPGECAS